MFKIFLLMLISVVSASVYAEGEYVTLRHLSAPMAHQAALAAYEDCSERGYNVAVAVVDRDGSLLSFIRSPLAGAHTIEVAKQKAWTSMSFKAPTTNLMLGESSDFMKEIPGALLIGGGLPINVGGFVYAAIGVSGAPAEKTPGDVDDACAIAGIDAIKVDLEMAE